MRGWVVFVLIAVVALAMVVMSDQMAGGFWGFVVGGSLVVAINLADADYQARRSQWLAQNPCIRGGRR
tara:strand:+ start:449 stop:652 length:204 start_codon:yes stop_codon:yes gene_type:complete